MLEQRLRSKTYWAALLTVGSGLLAYASPGVSEFIAVYHAELAILVGALFGGLREVTTEPLSDK